LSNYDYYDLEVHWLSAKTNRKEMVFARDLTEPMASNLIYKIMNRHPWPELSELIEKHEGSPFSYIIGGTRLEKNVFHLELVVHTILK